MKFLHSDYTALHLQLPSARLQASLYETSMILRHEEKQIHG